MQNNKNTKRWTVWVILGVCLLTGALLASSMLLRSERHSTLPVTIGEETFTVRLADTEPVRTRGLSGTRQLGERDGMLFVFDTDDTWGIWMKDMYIPIDILWLDKDRKIVHMQQNADPASFPTVFKPEKQSRYVIELAAGTIEKKGIGVGDMAQFTIGKGSQR